MSRSLLVISCFRRTLGLQIAQNRLYVYFLGRKVGIIYILGALGLGITTYCHKGTTFESLGIMSSASSSWPNSPK